MSSKITGLIEDGYTLEKRIPAAPGFYPVTLVRYRPMTERELARLRRRLADCPETDEGVDEAERLTCEAMAAHITEWNIENQAGRMVDPTVENIERLEPHLSGEIFRLISGADWVKTQKN